jgi:enoyl ACP reductase
MPAWRGQNTTGWVWPKLPSNPQLVIARDLGPENIRVNLVAAGPLRTIAAKSIPGFEEFEHLWNQRSALEWDFNDPVPAAQAAVVLLSDWLTKTTGEIIHVDGGVHAIGG